MLLLLDNYDSFSFNLYDYFRQCGAELEVLRNDEVEPENIVEKYQGIIISPGPGTPEKAGRCMEVIAMASGRIPLLGVCLGMQAIGLFSGAKLIKAAYPMHGKISNLTYRKDHPMFKNIIGDFAVCRYHSLILEESIGKKMDIIAYSEHQEIMAIDLPLQKMWGVQFHPEAILTPQGIKIINNWLKHFNLQYG